MRPDALAFAALKLVTLSYPANPFLLTINAFRGRTVYIQLRNYDAFETQPESGANEKATILYSAKRRRKFRIITLNSAESWQNRLRFSGGTRRRRGERAASPVRNL
jgi:hypothetical protein